MNTHRHQGSGVTMAASVYIRTFYTWCGASSSIRHSTRQRPTQPVSLTQLSPLGFREVVDNKLPSFRNEDTWEAGKSMQVSLDKRETSGCGHNKPYGFCGRKVPRLHDVASASVVLPLTLHPRVVITVHCYCTYAFSADLQV